MGVLEVVRYPHEALRGTAQRVDAVLDPDVQQQIQDLLDTMAVHGYCVGLAAPQVGYAVRILVMDCGRARKPAAGHHGMLVLCNPEILTWSGMEVGREGCLSLPDFTGNVVRATGIRVTFLDRDGISQTLDMAGFEARVLQHELDHLDGRLFIDRVVSPKADIFPRRH